MKRLILCVAILSLVACQKKQCYTCEWRADVDPYYTYANQYTNGQYQPPPISNDPVCDKTERQIKKYMDESTMEYKGNKYKKFCVQIPE